MAENRSIVILMVCQVQREVKGGSFSIAFKIKKKVFKIELEIRKQEKKLKNMRISIKKN